MQKEITVALVGNPNSGKTSLFNALTGLHYKVSNFPGTTVEKKIGRLKLGNNQYAKMVDLPGTYSLYPKSADELVTYDLLRNKSGSQFPDLVIFIADASNLKRNLLLLTQVADLKVPVLLALNMTDVAARKGIVYDIEVLQRELKLPVFEINARKHLGMERLKQAIREHDAIATVKYFDLQHLNQQMLTELCSITDKRNKYAALQYAVNASGLLNERADSIRAVFESYAFDVNHFLQQEVLGRYHIIDAAVKNARKKNQSEAKKSVTQKVDKVITHRVWGIVIFLLLLLLVFQAMFSWSEYPMQWVETSFSFMARIIESSLPTGVLNDLLVHGILPGLSGVMVFLPQIIILFLFIAVLEDVGYMARVGFIMDRMMRPFGMNGKSVVPLISGMACAVPSIMATRSIENKKERLITILVTPLMSCSARLPVYTLLIGMMLPDSAKWGPFNLHGLVLMGMYLIGFLAAVGSAWLFKRFIQSGQKNYFILELPGYKLPLLTNLMITLYEKAGAFVFGAGKIIVAVSVVLWAFASYGPRQSMRDINNKYEVLLNWADTTNAGAVQELKLKMNAEKLEASYAGEFGKIIEPIIRPLGFDWKIGIALLTSLAAREVFVGTVSTIYSANDQEGTDNFSSVKAKMQAEINPATGKPAYSLATIMSLMIFYAFALQCMSTIAIVKKETAGYKWPLVQFLYLTVLAYCGSWIIYALLN